MKKKRRWIKADAGGWSVVDIDYNIWHECKNKPGQRNELYCQNGEEVTCAVCGRTFRVRCAVYLEEKNEQEPEQSRTDSGS